MAKITPDTVSNLSEALYSNYDLKDEIAKIEPESDWIGLYFNNAFSDIKAAELTKVCEPMGLVYHFMAHPTHIYILVWPYTPSN